jgi:uncharacterized protein Yka (UPF0111/DUF47 family)
MTNQQLYLSIGIPALLYLLGFLFTITSQNRSFDAINKRIDDLRDSVNARLEQMNVRIAAIERRLDKLEDKLESRVIK